MTKKASRQPEALCGLVLQPTQCPWFRRKCPFVASVAVILIFYFFSITSFGELILSIISLSLRRFYEGGADAFLQMVTKWI